METLKLNDGTILNGHCIESGDILWVYLNDISLGDAFAVLNVPENTKKIIADRNGIETTYRGYKHLFCISEESSTLVSAGLRKG